MSERENRKEIDFICSLVELIHAKVIVEIGVQQGTVALPLCKSAAKNGGRYHGFDIWETHGLNNQFEQNGSKLQVRKILEDNNLDNFNLTKMDTIRDRDLFKLQLSLCYPDGIDFVFIDGCHSYKGIYSDFMSVYSLLSPIGVIVFHDTLRIDGCREFMLDLRTKYYDGTFDIMDFPFGQGDRRCGVSVLTKRSYPTINIGIDESCGSISSMKQIEDNERIWFQNEINHNKRILEYVEPKLRIEDIGYYPKRSKNE